MGTEGILMRSEVRKLNGTWQFREWGKGGEYLPGVVPGDVTRDMAKSLGETDLYVDFRYKKYKDFAHNDYEYTTLFDVSAEAFDKAEIYLEFLGVDTYADIFVNDVLVGQTSNMFLGYRFNVKRYVKRAGNKLTVHLKSIFRFMEKNDTHVCIFEHDRMFIRKASYQFGWDWAPNFPAYGIWQDVLLYGEDRNGVENVRVKQNISGDVTFLIDLKDKSYGGTLTVEMDGKTASAKTVGKKNIVALHIDSPRLWWPNGVGEQPLYDYTITFTEENCPTDVYKGYMAFRKVEMDEKVLDDAHIDFSLKINDLPVYLSGSNWVPQDCLTGTVTDETYRRHILQAKAGNMNILRVWGGGVYEKDIFYRLCDENGIMVLQETMFSCSDVPSDRLEFMDGVVVPELEYQLKRLQNHPSIVIWTGGNELFSPFGENEHAHLRFSEYTNRGMVNSLTDFYYYLTSPVGYTDITNLPYSGDGHNSTEAEFHDFPLDKVRQECLKQDRAPLTAETAIPCVMSYENLQKCTEAETLWPIGDYMRERLGCNPFGGYVPFVDIEMQDVRSLFGEDPKDLRDFIKKDYLASRERIGMEIALSRTTNGTGYLTWMFNDTWPNGSWAAIDYYLTPKAPYFALAQGFEPVAPVIFEEKNGKIGVFVHNERHTPVKVTVECGVRRISGEYLEESEKELTLAPAEKKKMHSFKKPTEKGAYVYARLHLGGKTVSRTYFTDFGAQNSYESKFNWQLAKVGEKEYKLVLTAEAFTRMVNIRVRSDAFFTLSDNFFDMEKDEKKVVTIYAEGDLKPENIEVLDFTKEW